MSYKLSNLRALKRLGEKINGTEPHGNSIKNVIDDIANNFSGEGGGLPTPTDDGVALISNSGQWTQQKGYGYSLDDGLYIEYDMNPESKDKIVVDTGGMTLEIPKIADYIEPEYLTGAKLTVYQSGNPSQTIPIDNFINFEDGFDVFIDSNTDSQIWIVTKGQHSFTGLDFEVPSDGIYLIYSNEADLITITTESTIIPFDPSLLGVLNVNLRVQYSSQYREEIAKLDVDPMRLSMAYERGYTIRATVTSPDEVTSPAIYDGIQFISFYLSESINGDSTLRATILSPSYDDDTIYLIKSFKFTSDEPV